MCKIICLLIILARCTLCIYSNRKPLGTIPVPRPGNQPNFTNGPTTYDRIPVFCAKKDGALIQRVADSGSYVYFMDCKDALDLLTEAHLLNILGKKKFAIVDTISLKKWFEMIDPSKERVDNYVMPRLLPSSKQDNKMIYKLRNKGDQEPIPVYYSEGLVGTNKRFWGPFKKNRVPKKVYFFNKEDLVAEIKKIENKVQREEAYKDIKVVSLVDLIKDNDPKELLFVMNNENSKEMFNLTRESTPWML